MFARPAFIVGVAVLAGLAPAAAQESVTVFAAASMKNALDEINAAFGANPRSK